MVYAILFPLFDLKLLFSKTKKGVPVEELLFAFKSVYFFIAAQISSSSYWSCKSKNKKS